MVTIQMLPPNINLKSREHKMWYKFAQIELQYEPTQLISNFSDRNVVNAQIRALKSLVDSLDRAIVIAEQTQGGAIKIAEDVMNNKKISSFPDCISALRVAIKVAKDSPKKFGHYCALAAEILEKRIGMLENMRNEFASNVVDKNKVKKGLF